MQVDRCSMGERNARVLPRLILPKECFGRKSQDETRAVQANAGFAMSMNHYHGVQPRAASRRPGSSIDVADNLVLRDIRSQLSPKPVLRPLAENTDRRE